MVQHLRLLYLKKMKPIMTQIRIRKIVLLHFKPIKLREIN